MSRILIMAPRVSDGARALAVSLSELDGVVARYRRLDRRGVGRYSNVNLAINWGCGNGGEPVTPSQFNAFGSHLQVLNPRTWRATNKLMAFETIRRWNRDHSNDEQINIPEFCTSLGGAREWAGNGGVFCRTQLRGHSGTDIVVARHPRDIVEAPLYTKLVNKRHEFRLHVAGGQVIDGVRKAFRQDVPESQRNYDVRNHAAGSVFIRSGRSLSSLQMDPVAQAMAVNACRALGLDFGAVDMMTDQEGNFYILEVNTAPGLEATTLARYTDAFHKISRGERVLRWQDLPLNPNATTETQTQTQETNSQETTMPALTLSIQTLRNHREARQALEGQTVTPTNEFRGSTLTAGRAYEVRHCTVGDNGQVRLTVHNDQGRAQRYTLNTNNFRLGGQSAAPQLPEAQANNEVDTSLPVDSPLRCVRLQDGSQVNVGGQAQFNLSNSRFLSQDTPYTVAEIRVGSETGTAFLGINVEGRVRRWRLDSFSNGERVAATAQATTSNSSSQNRPSESLQTSTGQRVEVGTLVRVNSRNGNHGIRVGTSGTVRSINVSNGTLVIEGQTRAINVRRVEVVTPEQVQQENQIREQQNNTVSVSFAGTNYRIRSRDQQQVQTLLNQLTV